MKPHKEQLTVRKSDHEYRIVREEGADDPLRRYSLAMVYTPGPNDDPEVGSYEKGEELAKARAKQFAAAPEMVRALRNLLGESRHLSTCPALRSANRGCKPECQQVQTALVMAGIPLP